MTTGETAVTIIVRDRGFKLLALINLVRKRIDVYRAGDQRLRYSEQMQHSPRFTQEKR